MVINGPCWAKQIREFKLSAFDWGPLRTTVLGAIKRGHIGRPAALRLTVHGPGGESERGELEAELRDVACTWFGGSCESDYVAGGKTGPSVLALKWAGGQSAILSVSAGGGRAGGNMMLLGSNGVIYHEIDPVAVLESQTRSGSA